MSALTELAATISKGLDGESGDVKEQLRAVVAERYGGRVADRGGFRDAYKLAKDDGVPYAGITNPDNPPTGQYGGTSIAWFPTNHTGSLLTFVVGTLGLSPDEGILTRPGHRRRIAALRRVLSDKGVKVWTKPDPAALGVAIPKTAQAAFPGFEAAFKRYGSEMYCVAKVPDDPDHAAPVVQMFLDLYAYERGWSPLAAAKDVYSEFHGRLLEDTFATIDAAGINALLRNRRFVILQGPPGTGKTRLADEIRREFFGGRGVTVQFHPAVAYEDFVIGLAPEPKEGTLKFGVREGWLLQAADLANEGPCLLVIDEVNRADLGKVLGEAIYLFEAGEVGGDQARRVRLPHPRRDGEQEFAFPPNLYLLATMNTADRSISSMDLAVRRRFAFVTMMPSRKVVAEQGHELATTIFERLVNLFVEHAPDEALDLLPGHAYFLAQDETELRERFRYELIPLLNEYLRQGLLGRATTDLYAVRDEIEDRLAERNTE